MSIYAQFGVRTLINATGTVTRLSGGLMRPEVAAAMTAASAHCVDMAELQAAASREIATITGAEAGYVASGASACLLLAAAACMARDDPGRMARLPNTRGMRNEIIMARSQRNFYDHAIRASGATIVEVGLPDRFAGAGVRDAEAWEIEDAIGENTAAIFHVAGPRPMPPLRDFVRVAEQHHLPVIVDAAAQLPPQSNLRRFIEEGATLVAFSGGKVIGGPQASGFLCGKRDLIMSAALQHLDLDVFDDMWQPPSELIDRKRLKGIPQHGIGRSCKAGKEEIVGLLTALRLFVAEGDATRHAVWLRRLRDIKNGIDGPPLHTQIEGETDETTIPKLLVSPSNGKPEITSIVRALVDSDPSIHVDASRRIEGVFVVNPASFSDDDIPAIIKGITAQRG